MKSLRYPPFAKPSPLMEAPARLTEASRQEAAEVLPSIDEFLDDLPSIDDFLDVAAPAVIAQLADVEVTPSVAIDTPRSEEGWAPAEWQSYDWGSLASLNRAIPHGAGSDETWDDADWPEPYPRSSPAPVDRGATPTADEIADALYGIAHRIRSGELVIDNLHGTPPEAAMAAALAVLLRMRG